MRWEGLFADLEAQAEALAAAERAGEVDDRVRAELGRIRFLDRLRPAVGLELRLRCAGGASVAGKLTRAGEQWLLMDEGAGREALVPMTAVLAVAGLGRLAAAPDDEAGRRVESRLGLGYVLRGVARDRSGVRLSLSDDTTLDGTIDRVGRDFIELALHATAEHRRRTEVREVLVVPFGAIAVLRRDLAG